MGPPILQMVKLLFDPDVSKKMILQLAYKQIRAIGFLKVFSLLLSSGIVGVSSIIKIPQIKKITNPKLLEQRVKVAEGLSLPGISLESLNQLIHVVYNKQNNNLFIGYGEAFLLGLQNIVIILLMEYYRTRAKLTNANIEESIKIKASLKSLVKPIVVLAALIVGLGKVIPPAVINGLQILSIPLSIVSKIPQIKKNHELKSTAHLSNVTVGANVLGSLSRVFTTVQSFDKLGRDKVLLTGYASSLVLNSVLAGQCYVYGKKKEEDEKKIQ